MRFSACRQWHRWQRTARARAPRRRAAPRLARAGQGPLGELLADRATRRVDDLARCARRAASTCSPSRNSKFPPPTCATCSPPASDPRYLVPDAVARAIRATQVVTVLPNPHEVSMAVKRPVAATFFHACRRAQAARRLTGAGSSKTRRHRERPQSPEAVVPGAPHRPIVRQGPRRRSQVTQDGSETHGCQGKRRPRRRLTGRRARRARGHEGRRREGAGRPRHHRHHRHDGGGQRHLGSARQVDRRPCRAALQGSGLPPVRHRRRTRR